jgi:hypothetical protein
VAVVRLVAWWERAGSAGSRGVLRSRMTGGKASAGIGMEDTRFREPSSSQSEGTLPGDRAFLAAAAKCMPPVPKYPFAVINVRRESASELRIPPLLPVAFQG